MRFDNVLQTLLESLGKGDTVEEGMRSVIGACSRMRPHPDWDTFSEMDFRSEPSNLRAWIPGILNDFPPDDRLAGLFFGLYTFYDDTSDETLSDLVLAGTTDYKPDDSGWVESTRELWDSWGPFEAQSEVLRTIYAVRTRPTMRLKTMRSIHCALPTPRWPSHTRFLK